MKQELHPVGMLLEEFKNVFLHKNRHLLFVECKNPNEASPTTLLAEKDFILKV